MFDKRLAEALNFTEEDLIANCDGYMTKPQRVKLRKSFSGWQAGLWLLTTFLCLAVSIPNLFMQSLKAMQQDFIYIVTTPMFFLYCAPFIVFVVIWGLLAYFGGRNARADLWKGEVAHIDGLVTIQGKSAAHPELHLDNGWWFIIPHKAIKVFVENHRYTIYYAPHTMQILSAEPMVEP
jgi:hypothetical protein